MKAPAWLRHPAVGFILRFGLFLGLAQVLFVSFLNESRLMVEFFVFNAHTATLVLDLLGIEAIAKGCLVLGEGQSIQVAFGCDGSQALLVLGACVVAYPASVVQRLVGLAVGIPLLLVLNAVRIASLFWVSVNHPGAFEQVHLFLWPALFMAGIFAIWSLWIRWTLRGREED